MNSDRQQIIQENCGKLLYENQLWRQGCTHIAGIDEAGRGPLAGPVVAAAVVFPHNVLIPEVTDSKELTASQREELFPQITGQALAIGIGVVGHEVIDTVNILNATYRAMHEAIRGLAVRPDHLLIDGNRFEDFGIPFTTIVDGDALSFSISAASIVAKVIRDRIMVNYDSRYPGYGFARHKGYSTPEHRDAILRLGFCEIHRRSFAFKTQLELDFDGAEDSAYSADDGHRAL